MLERHLSPGVYNYYFMIDGRHKVDTTKPTIGKGHHRRNIITVCNPSVLGGQGGPFTDGRLSHKNIDAVSAYGGDISNLLENSTVDMVKKASRQSSRAHSRLTGSRPNSQQVIPRPNSTDGAHMLNAMLTIPKNPNVSAEGLSKTWNPRGGAKMTVVSLVHNVVCDDGCWALAEALLDNHRVTELDLSSNLITSEVRLARANSVGARYRRSTYSVPSNPPPPPPYLRACATCPRRWPRTAPSSTCT